MRKRGKNKGFTLIEVIIALAILAVALSPLIANFVVSSKMNLKSRKNLNAMNLAQDMMEGIRAYSASELRNLLENAAAPTTPTSIVGTVLPANTTYDSCTADLTGAPNLYKYTISNIQTVSNNQIAAGKGNDKTNTYNVDVELTADTAVYDGKDMASIASVDQYWNPVYTMSEAPEDSEATAIDAIYEKVKDNPAASGKTKDTLKNDIRREIRLNTKVTTDAGTGNKAYSTTIEVVHSIRSEKYGDWGINPSNDADVSNATYSSGQRNISKAAASDCPTAIYLYYTGLSAKPGNRNDYDTIKITNRTEQDVTVYLIRTQVRGEATSLEAYNQSYRCRVDLEAKREDGNIINGTDPGWIYLVTNVRYHLNYGEELNKRNKNEDDDDIPLPAEVTSYYDRDRANIYYNTTANMIVESDYQQCVSDGYRKSDQGLLYKVRLTISDANSGEVMATYDGGTVN